MNNWWKRNLLSLNFEKKKKNPHTHFVTKNDTPGCMQIGYDNKVIPNITHTKFLGLLIDNTLTWKNHIELLINWLSTASYVV